MPSMRVRESTFSEPCTVRLPPCHIEVDPPTSNCPVETAGTVEARVRRAADEVWRPGTRGEASVELRRSNVLGALWWNARQLVRTDLLL